MRGYCCLLLVWRWKVRWGLYLDQGMADYFDLTDILAEDEILPVQFLVAANGVGSLDPSSEDDNVAVGSKVDLPFWLARDLATRDAVSISLPSCFNQRVRKEVQADPGCVNLNSRCVYFYELGLKLIPYIADSTLGSFLFYTFRGRYKDILCKAHRIKIPLETLTNLEAQMVQMAYQSIQAFKKWYIEGTRLKCADVLSRKRKYNIDSL